MRVRRIVARSMPEAVARVRSELGPEAVILASGPERRRGVFGWFGRRQVEVLAAVPEPDHMPAPAVRPSVSLPSARPTSRIGDAEPLPAPRDSGDDRVAQVIEPMQRDLAGLRQMVATLAERLEPVHPAVPPAYQPVSVSLIEAGVEPSLVDDLIAEAIAEARASNPSTSQSSVSATATVARCIVRRLGPARTIVAERGRVVSLVGPTGVGKTTTVAKLAARFALVEGRSVALVTTDTYRIGAVDQLRTYAGILDVPVEVVGSPGEADAALARHRHRDLILVDTAGRSYQNRMHLSELRQVLEAIRPDECYLVQAVPTGLREARQAAEAFRLLKYDRLLFTKLDEAESPALILNVAMALGLPLSYVTTGQGVPDDIEVARPEALVAQLLQEKGAVR